MTGTAMTNKQNFPLMDTLVAAIAAHRVNGEYLRESYTDFNTKVVRTANKVLVLNFLTTETESITSEDRENATKMYEYFQGFIIKVLSGKINSFETTVMKIVDKPEVTFRDLGLISSLPSVYYRGIQKQTVEDMLAQCNASYLAEVDTKVSTTAKVVKSLYSQQYGCYFITTITESNNRVFFSYKEGLTPFTTIKVAGRVKAHRSENTTQLTRAKITKI
jgi:hypothetical protein